ncbi:MAG: hypothetical protein ACP5N9_03030 [Candidatus Bilamarchaeum sp.]|jgi:hypothetical protein
MVLNTFVDENRGAIMFTILFIIIGAFGYFTFSSVNFGWQSQEKNLFDGAKFKVATEADGTIEIFANIKNNEIANIKASEGNQIPEDNSIVIGYNQDLNIKKQGKFSKVGNHLIDYFGINTTIEGTLQKRDDIVDDLTFLSPKQFEQINGQTDIVFAKKTKDGQEKLFYRFLLNKTNMTMPKFAEGSMSGYSTHDLDGTIYYPIIIGAKGAKIMQEKKIFTNTGDPIRNFFGRDFVVSGILQETNTSIDRLYFVTVNPWDMSDEKN